MKKAMFIVVIFSLFACSTAEINQEDTSTKTENTKTTTNSIKKTEDTLINSSTSNQRIVVSDKEFLTFYQKFSTAISNTDVISFNECMDANFGLYLIESPGAIPYVSKVYDISKFKSKSNNNNFFEFTFNKITNTPIFEDLPKVVCEKEAYDKRGCFAQFINPLYENQLWKYSDLNEKELQPIEKLASLVKITVINTYNYTFYFTFIDKKWCISFIDLRIPCQA